MTARSESEGVAKHASSGNAPHQGTKDALTRKAQRYSDLIRRSRKALEATDYAETRAAYLNTLPESDEPTKSLNEYLAEWQPSINATNEYVFGH